MTPEMQLAQSLGSLPTTKAEKTAAAMQEMSIEELEAFLKSEGTEKTAKLRSLAEAADKTCPKMKKATMVKKSAVDLADRWGRDLARAGLEKTALMPPVGAMAGQGINAAMRMKPVARMAGGAAMGAAGGALSGMMASPNPQTGQRPSVLGRAAVGAGLGAGAAAGLGAAVKAKGAVGQATRGAMKQGKAATKATAGKAAAKPAAAAAAPAAAAPAPAQGSLNLRGVAPANTNPQMAMPGMISHQPVVAPDRIAQHQAAAARELAARQRPWYQRIIG